MTKQKETQVESLIAVGLIGAALGALISSKHKGASALLGGIAGAALAASIDAFEKAKQTNLPILIEENDVLYELNADGTKRKIKDLPVSNTVLPKYFDLK